ncbi:MAG TPA: aspartate kinase [Polyangia bacterium]|nr:aspartate kinase [Polyangia bacterium]
MEPEQAAPIVVQKYGGSSVADAERLRLVADRVAATYRSGKRVVVVVSAMGKTTDQLIDLAKAVSTTPPRRELDMLISTGERISMALLAMALDRLGVPAISFTGSQSGILTNDRHSGARIIEVRPVRIQDELDRNKVVIVAGFQGMSYKREITTLGRGGSDTTAVALAAALGAEACEIYSDVDGVYSADPRVVPEARRLDEVSYEEMQELAEHGAKVLNAQAVEWARKAGIVLYARATGGKTGGGTGETRIGGAPREDRGALAVTGTRRLMCVRLPDPNAELAPRLLALLGEEGVVLRQWRLRHGGQGERDGRGVEVRFVCDDLPDWPRVAARLGELPGCRIEEHGAVVVVGTGVGSDPHRVARALAAVRATGAVVHDCDATPLRLLLVVPPAAVDEVTRALHAELVARAVETPQGQQRAS